MIHLFKIIILLLALILLLVPFIIITLLIKLSSKGPAIIWSKRIGYLNNEFKMPKFRTMVIETPQLATHLLDDPRKYITPIGKIIRRLSLDEIPQIISVIKGDMNIVGPRPALYNQYDLINLRKEKSIHLIKPGITGWAQINGRDSISIEKKVEMDSYYLENKSLVFDIKIVFLTFLSTLKNDNVSH